MTNKITVDGNTATALVAYKLSELATIYPITPSSGMAELCDTLSSRGEKNIFGEPLKVVEMQSEGGAAGALHGGLTSGALTTTFTSSQGLLLMIPNMYKIAGEMLPCVIHVSARAIATHALSIFGDHSDVMAVRQTGFNMICSSSVQEAQDFALISHISALKASLPFVHFFDGFRTSHEINTIFDINFEDVKKIYPFDKYYEFKSRALNSNSPVQRGTAQNPDVFFQNKEACNKYYNAVPKIVESVMDDVYSITGRRYHIFDYYGAKDAENIIVLMGSGATTVKTTVEYLNKLGKKVGVLVVRLYRPFDSNYFIEKLPKSVKRIAVLDRTKESGADGEPLYKDVICAVFNAKKDIKVYGGRYGLGSKEFTPSMVNAVFENLSLNEPKNNFTIGIEDDVTNLSLKVENYIYPTHGKVTSCKFYGYGGDGTVSANKSSIKIIGNNTDLNAQAYFEYDSKKSGNATISHLRFGKDEINESYLLDNANFVSVHNQTYVTKYNILKGLIDGGTLLINTNWTDEEIDHNFPNSLKQEIVKRNIKLYTINAYDLAKEIGLGNKINLIMQSCFFKLINIIPFDKAKEEMKHYALVSYGKKGEDVLNKNYLAIDKAIDNLYQVNVPEDWGKYDCDCSKCSNTNSNLTIDKNSKNPYFENYIKPIQSLEGDKLPVSAFSPDGTVPTGTTKLEKRGIATMLPCWESENCIQCNMCSFVCPHAAIRPALIKSENLKNAPESLKVLDATAEKDLKFVMQINPLDCTGCGVCSSVCPAKNKALVMKPFDDIKNDSQINYEYVNSVPHEKSSVFKENTVKGSQFNEPYFEFSGACAGCGETPYIKVISQLFGDKMIVANATGCSSIYGGSSPTCPYTKDENGHGIAWSNSLFEDNAEFGYGIKLATQINENKLNTLLNTLLEQNVSDNFKTNIKDYLKSNNTLEQRNLGNQLLEMISNENVDKQFVDELNSLKCVFGKQSVWMFGGDGWAYDIGYGGLDHVLASGQNVNVLVLDTEVYSNTGGQSSKATPLGASAKFASAGKRTNKKDLALMAMAYKNVYVAKVSMGANMQQFLKAVIEAENYDGPSLIIAYAPCINHGIDMKNSSLEQKKAVETGYWHLFRYNPELAKENKNPFMLDSPEPKLDYMEFLNSESRYTALLRQNETEALKLFEEAKEFAMKKYNEYKEMANK